MRVGSKKKLKEVVSRNIKTRHTRVVIVPNIKYVDGELTLFVVLVVVVKKSEIFFCKTRRFFFFFS